jgi:pimeloyl-ACP methyl ester carboxylesterase
MVLRRMVEVGGLSLACTIAGQATQPALVLLHGWPHSSALYGGVIDSLARDTYAIAIDLPDVGASRGAPPSSEKHVLADLILSAAEQLGARSMIVGGLDVGGMIAFAAARAHARRIEGAVVMNTVIPGIDPWPKIIADPRIWHFAFHNVTGLPESLVVGRQRQYFDFFFDFLAKNKAVLTDQLRDEMTAAYARPESLHAGFEWYRAMAEDAKRNAVVERIDLSLLYLRGDADGRRIDDYADGLCASGTINLISETIEGSGEYLPVEAPARFIEAMQMFRSRVQGRTPQSSQ